IAEVLLGSVRPFELMMGKLAGSVAVSLTLAAIYAGGATVIAIQLNMTGYIHIALIVWFVLFMIIGAMMYGAMFVAVGAAVTNVKEAQSLIGPMTLITMFPIFLVQPMFQDPNGTLALIGTFFPFSAPMVTTARLAIPPGIPMWQAAGGAIVSIATMIF